MLLGVGDRCGYLTKVLLVTSAYFSFHHLNLQFKIIIIAVGSTLTQISTV